MRKKYLDRNEQLVSEFITGKIKGDELEDLKNRPYFMSMVLKKNPNYYDLCPDKVKLDSGVVRAVVNNPLSSYELIHKAGDYYLKNVYDRYDPEHKDSYDMNVYKTELLFIMAEKTKDVDPEGYYYYIGEAEDRCETIASNLHREPSLDSFEKVRNHYVTYNNIIDCLAKQIVLIACRTGDSKLDIDSMSEEDIMRRVREYCDGKFIDVFDYNPDLLNDIYGSQGFNSNTSAAPIKK